MVFWQFVKLFEASQNPLADFVKKQRIKTALRFLLGSKPQIVYLSKPQRHHTGVIKVN